MARVVMSKTGKKITLLNPSEKKEKYEIEKKYGYAKTNDMQTKRDKNGKGVALTQEQKIWRSGYISACIDNQKAFFSRKNRGK